MAHIHRIRYEAHALGMDDWLSTVEGRVTVANILHYARCRDLHLEADLVPVPELVALLERQGYRCVYCPFRIIRDFQLDHIVPVARGGGHILSNIQFLCPICNRSKSDNGRPKNPRDGAGWGMPDHTAPVVNETW
jgi:5-methylcytosine-specific restriction endonuclease McrA